jgi:hypothetical protein
MDKPPIIEEAESIMAELNGPIAAGTVRSLLECPTASRGLAKLLMALSATRVMSGTIKPGDPDPFIDAAGMVLKMRVEWDEYRKSKGSN